MKIHPFVITVGIAFIAVFLLILGPAVLGTADSSYDLTKYNGTSQHGTDLVKEKQGSTSILVFISANLFQITAYIAGVLAFCVLMYWVSIKIFRKKSAPRHG